jgi:hypothetical protein
MQRLAPVRPSPTTATPALIATVLATVALAACSGADDTSTRARDSGAIRIIESNTPSIDSANAWRVSPEPRLAIGVEEGPQHFQFSRIGGVTRLPGGSIVVGDGGSSQLRFFDSTGGFVTAAGRPGQGPGEFGQFSSLRIWRAPTGELLVGDEGNARINVFDAKGAYLRAVKLAPAPNGPRVFFVDVFADGSWLASAPDGGGRLNADVVGPLPPMKFSYLRYAPNGEFRTRIVDATDRPRYVNEYGRTRHFPYIPLMPEPLLAASGTDVLLYRGPAAEIERWSADGQQRSVLRWKSAEPRKVADIWERYVTESLDEMEGEQRAQYQHYYQQNLALPAVVPAAEKLLVDAEANVWLRRYRLPWETAQRWDVLADDGEWLTTVTTPDRLTVSQIGRDFVLGTHRDSLGVERVQLHALARGAPEP